MLFLEGNTLLWCMLEILHVICMKLCCKLTLYRGGRDRETKSAENWQSVPTILVSIAVVNIRMNYQKNKFQAIVFSLLSTCLF